ncbi:MAG: hypothetical protein AAFN27_03985 [Pseudomonadota bacterium]
MIDQNATGPTMSTDDELDGAVGGAAMTMARFAIQTGALEGDDDDPDADAPVAKVSDMAWDISKNAPA